MATSEPTQGISWFSTEGGLRLARSAGPILPSTVARPDPERDARLMIQKLRARWPHFCNQIFAPWDIRWFFDELDFYQLGGQFLYHQVVRTMQRENEEMLVWFCRNWSQCNKDNFHVVRHLAFEKLFHQRDVARYGNGFLIQAHQYMCAAYDRAVLVEAEAQDAAGSLPAAPRILHSQRSISGPQFLRGRFDDRRNVLDDIPRAIEYGAPSSWKGKQRIMSFENRGLSYQPHRTWVSHKPPQIASARVPLPMQYAMQPYANPQSPGPLSLTIASPFLSDRDGSVFIEHPFHQSEQIPEAMTGDLHDDRERSAAFATPCMPKVLGPATVPDQPPQRGRSASSARLGKNTIEFEDKLIKRTGNGKMHRAQWNRKSSTSSTDVPPELRDFDQGFVRLSKSGRNRRSTLDWKANQERHMPAPVEHVELNPSKQPSDSAMAKSDAQANYSATLFSQSTDRAKGSPAGHLVDEPLRVDANHIGEHARDACELYIPSVGDISEPVLRDIYSRIAPVLAIRIVAKTDHEGTARRFAYLRFQSSAQARKVLQESNRETGLSIMVSKNCWYPPVEHAKNAYRSPSERHTIHSAPTDFKKVRAFSQDCDWNTPEPISALEGSNDLDSVKSSSRTGPSKPEAAGSADIEGYNAPSNQSCSPPQSTQVVSREPHSSSYASKLTQNMSSSVYETAIQSSKRLDTSKPIDEVKKYQITSAITCNDGQNISQSSAWSNAHRASISNKEERSVGCDTPLLPSDSVKDNASSLAPSSVSSAPVPQSSIVEGATTRPSSPSLEQAGNDFDGFRLVGSGKRRANKVSHSSKAPEQHSGNATYTSSQPALVPSGPATFSGPSSTILSHFDLPMKVLRNEKVIHPDQSKSGPDAGNAGRGTWKCLEKQISLNSLPLHASETPGKIPADISASNFVKRLSPEQPNHNTRETQSTQSISIDHGLTSSDCADDIDHSAAESSDSTKVPGPNPTGINDDFLKRHALSEWRKDFEKLQGILSNVTDQDRVSWSEEARKLENSLLQAEGSAHDDEARMAGSLTPNVRKRLKKRRADRSKTQQQLVDELAILVSTVQRHIETIQIDHEHQARKLRDTNRSAYPRANPNEDSMTMQPNESSSSGPDSKSDYFTLIVVRKDGSLYRENLAHSPSDSDTSAELIQRKTGLDCIRPSREENTPPRDSNSNGPENINLIASADTSTLDYTCTMLSDDFQPAVACAEACSKAPSSDEFPCAHLQPNTDSMRLSSEKVQSEGQIKLSSCESRDFPAPEPMSSVIVETPTLNDKRNTHDTEAGSSGRTSPTIYLGSAVSSPQLVMPDENLDALDTHFQDIADDNRALPWTMNESSGNGNEPAMAVYEPSEDKPLPAVNAQFDGQKQIGEQCAANLVDPKQPDENCRPEKTTESEVSVVNRPSRLSYANVARMSGSLPVVALSSTAVSKSPSIGLDNHASTSLAHNKSPLGPKMRAVECHRGELTDWRSGDGGGGDNRRSASSGEWQVGPEGPWVDPRGSLSLRMVGGTFQTRSNADQTVGQEEVESSCKRPWFDSRATAMIPKDQNAIEPRKDW